MRRDIKIGPPIAEPPACSHRGDTAACGGRKAPLAIRSRWLSSCRLSPQRVYLDATRVELGNTRAQIHERSRLGCRTKAGSRSLGHRLWCGQRFRPACNGTEMPSVRLLAAQTPTLVRVVESLQQATRSSMPGNSLHHWVWLGLSAFVTSVQLGQFIPQHIELYRRKSVVGLSAWTLFFGSLYTYLTMVDYLVQSRVRWLRSCPLGWSTCFLESQPFVQVVGSWLLVSLLWFWYLRYEKLDEARELQRTRAGIVFVESSNKPLWTSSKRRATDERVSRGPAATALPLSSDDGCANEVDAESPDPQWWHAVPSEHYRHAHYRHHRYYFDDSAYAAVFFRIFCATVVVVGVPTAAWLMRDDLASTGLENSFADICGYLATLLCTVMWIPQIITTYTYGHRGSLSKMWVLFTFISDVVYSAYLSALHVPFSVWANNVPDGFCALFLFVLIRIEERRERENATCYTSPTTTGTARSETAAIAIASGNNYGSMQPASKPLHDGS